MRVLYLTHSCPFPPNKGDRIRNFHILKHLAEKHQVSLIYPSFSSKDEGCLDTLRKFCVSVKTVHMSPILANLRCAFGLFGSKPLTNAYFYSPHLQEMVDQERYDLAIADCSSMAQYVMNVKIPKMIDFVDVDSDKWNMYAQKSKFPKSLIYKREYARLREFEACLVKEFDVSIVISDQERDFLPDTERLFVVRNGIDLEFFEPRRETNNEPTLIFTGAMNYFPNIDGVLFFNEEVFPRIQRAVPAVKFIVGGMEPSPAIQQLASDHTIVTGFVPDMRAYLREASVSVVPLRIAKGIQNKVLEAMAMRVPVVATTLANQGINAKDGKEVMIADNPEDFAQAVIELLINEKMRISMADNARQFVEEHFSWEQNLAALDKAIKTAFDNQDTLQNALEEVASV